jgi:hypothetical protein
MSFGTFTLFNFYQQPNTGKVPERSSLSDPEIDSIIHGHGVSGAIADFNWKFPYAGTLTPYAVVQGGGAGFQIPIYSDSDIGLRHGFITLNFSGEFAGSVDQSSNSFLFSGDIFPSYQDVGSSNLSFSGEITGCPIEYGDCIILTSGQFTGDAPNLGFYVLTFSGIQTPDKSENSTIKNLFSGYMIREAKEEASSSIGFSGSFFPVSEDSSMISYNFSGFSAANNITIYSIETGDQITNIKYGFLGYTAYEHP